MVRWTLEPQLWREDSFVDIAFIMRGCSMIAHGDRSLLTLVTKQREKGVTREKGVLIFQEDDLGNRGLVPRRGFLIFMHGDEPRTSAKDT